LVSLAHDLTILIQPQFYKRWENYFDTAELFCFIWLGAISLATSKQRKTIEKTRLEALEKEKEFQLTASLKAELEVKYAQKTDELERQKNELQKTLNELKSIQSQLIQSEKMASLGELTAGIAHEIQNPLNFVNNFSELNSELILELKDELKKGNLEEVKNIVGDIVNPAQRLQSAAKENQIIISENSYRKVKESFNCQKVGEVNLKNKADALVIYEVLD
jgi:two-component system NtrC family sensor kinase